MRNPAAFGRVLQNRSNSSFQWNYINVRRKYQSVGISSSVVRLLSPCTAYHFIASIWNIVRISTINSGLETTHRLLDMTHVTPAPCSEIYQMVQKQIRIEYTCGVTLRRQSTQSCMLAKSNIRKIHLALGGSPIPNQKLLWSIQSTSRSHINFLLPPGGPSYRGQVQPWGVFS